MHIIMGSKVKCLYSNSNVDKAIKEIKAENLSANKTSKNEVFLEARSATN